MGRRDGDDEDCKQGRFLGGGAEFVPMGCR